MRSDKHRRMRLAFVLAGLVRTSARPGNLDRTNCAQVTQIIGGTAPTIMGATAVPGNALSATAGGVLLTTGGTYIPGGTIALANAGGGDYGLYADVGTLTAPILPLCGGKLLTVGGTLTAPLTGPLNIVGMRAAGFGTVTYELLQLTPSPGGGIDGGIDGVPPPPPGGGAQLGDGQGVAASTTGDSCGNGAGGFFGGMFFSMAVILLTVYLYSRGCFGAKGGGTKMAGGGGGSPWSEAKDADGRTYYYNAKTGETSWMPPAS